MLSFSLKQLWRVEMALARAWLPRLSTLSRLQLVLDLEFVEQNPPTDTTTGDDGQ